jgi:hypothetical protein
MGTRAYGGRSFDRLAVARSSGGNATLIEAREELQRALLLHLQRNFCERSAEPEHGICALRLVDRRLHTYA